MAALLRVLCSPLSPLRLGAVRGDGQGQRGEREMSDEPHEIRPLPLAVHRQTVSPLSHSLRAWLRPYEPTTDRYTVEGAHTDKTYTYSIGICVDADSHTPECAVKQTDSTSTNSSSFCIGKNLPGTSSTK